MAKACGMGIAIAWPLPNCMAGDRAALAAEAAGKDQTPHRGSDMPPHIRRTTT
jgi:hypothetical protein